MLPVPRTPRRLTSFLAALLVLSASTLPATTFADLHRELEAAVEDGRLPSVAMAVARGGEVVWEAALGWADREREVPATVHTPYALASVSKPFTATVLMRLAERGLVELDLPVERYLAGVRLAAPPGRSWRPTVRQVAGHTAGLPPYHRFFVPGGPEDGGARAGLERSGFLAHPPGSRFEYSNLGYAVLERVIEEVTGGGFGPALETELLRPLGLEHGAFLDGRREVAAAVRYGAGDRRLPAYLSDHGGGSAVVACVRDLVRFGSLHLGRRPAGVAELLGRHSLAQMRRPSGRRTRLAGSYGIGWTVHPGPGGTTVVRHDGGMPGAGAALALVPGRGLAVAVLANTRSELVQWAAAAALAAASPRWREPTDWLPPAPEPRPCRGAPPRRLRGRWTGRALVEGAARPLELVLAPRSRRAGRPGEVAAGSVLHWRGGPESSLAPARFCGRRRLEAWAAGPLPGAPAGAGPGRIRLCLEREGEELLGAATAYFRTPGGLPAALSYPVRLVRARDDGR